MILLVAVAAAAGCVLLEGDRILARHLAERVPAFAAVAPETAIGPAPAPGSRRTVGAGELARLSAKFGLEGPAAGAGLCFELARAPLDKVRVQAALGTDGAELVDFSRGLYPAGTIEFPRNGLGPPQPNGIALWRGRLRYGTAHSVPLWARVRLRLRAAQVVAARALPAGRVLTAADLALCEVEGRAGGPARIEEAEGRLLRRAVREGQRIEAALLGWPKDVEPGAAVEVVAQAGGARLEAQARAETGGRVGDWVVVRNLASGKRLRARVAGKGQVRVETAGGLEQ